MKRIVITALTAALLLPSVAGAHATPDRHLALEKAGHTGITFPGALDPCGFYIYHAAHTGDVEYAAIQANESQAYVATPGYDLVCVTASDVTLYTMGVGPEEPGDHVRTSDGAGRPDTDASGLTIRGDIDPLGNPIVTVPSTYLDEVYRLYVQTFDAGTVVYGTNGIDVLYDYEGLGVTLYGNDGDDWISTWGGEARLIGGGGEDRVESFVTGTIEEIVELGGAGNDILRTGSDGSFLSGASGADRLLAKASADGADLLGGTGGDVLKSYADDSLLKGDAGNDVLNATAYADSAVLRGGPGKDVLVARDRDDIVRGGTGRDVCRIVRGVTRSSCEVVRYL